MSAETKKLRLLYTGPTHYHEYGSSTLDHVYTNCKKVASQGLITDTLSDHTPLYVVRRHQSVIKTQKKITGRSYKKYSKENTGNFAKNRDWRDVTGEDVPVEAAYDNFITAVGSYLDEAHPIREFTVKYFNDNCYSKTIATLVKKKRRLLKRARKVPVGVRNDLIKQAQAASKRIDKEF